MLNFFCLFFQFYDCVNRKSLPNFVIPWPWSKSDFLLIVCYDIGFFRLLLGYGSSVPMNSRTGKGPAVRSYRRRKAVLDLDLNRVPAGDNREHEGPSIQLGPQVVIVEQQPPASQPTMIDVEDIDDDVVECTPGAFAEVYLPSFMVFSIIFFIYYILLLEIKFFFILICVPS